MSPRRRFDVTARNADSSSLNHVADVATPPPNADEYAETGRSKKRFCTFERAGPGKISAIKAPNFAIFGNVGLVNCRELGNDRLAYLGESSAKPRDLPLLFERRWLIVSNTGLKMKALAAVNSVYQFVISSGLSRRQNVNGLGFVYNFGTVIAGKPESDRPNAADNRGNVALKWPQTVWL